MRMKIAAEELAQFLKRCMSISLWLGEVLF